MRIWQICALVWLGQPVGANPAGPLERPPEEFAGAQYIDSAGCVYLRQGSVWAPRLDRDGAVICGYPPSLPFAAGSVDPGADAALRLSVTLADGLQDGDLHDDPNDPLRRMPAPTPHASEQRLTGLEASLKALPSMRAAAAGSTADSQQLCDLLGYDENQGRGAGTGATLGICAGGGADLTPKVTHPANGGVAGDQGRRDVAATPVNASRAKSGSARRAQASQKAGSGKNRDTSRLAVVSGSTNNQSVEMIPAGAHYVQIGRFTAERAETVIQGLLASGYPVVRSTAEDPKTGGRLIMAGPFSDRQAVIVALSQLRGAGYPGAFAR
ncbi:SPOR domain-containing protein [Paracoccus tegillarcae]|nr:SPOR domain-containing protein [Paracoccus tegillarcae]